MKFRPDIEGLRAVAILLVIAAHADVPALAGGFIGVDVFFVLSGYLITGLLTSELAAQGRIELARFYARRFRRLFPALLLVVACTCVLGQQLLPVAEQPDQALAAATSIVWLSNFHFAFAALDYFGPAADTNLFLHAWSLGVEEQFYVVWPALLVLLATAGRPARGSVDLRRLRPAFAAVAVLGFPLSVAWTATDPVPAFYLMPSRAWQFALGAAVFLHFDGSSAAQGWRGLLRWTGWLGLGAILASALLIDANTPYPGIWAALPSLGTAAVLASGARLAQAGVGRLLSLAPMQALGRVSYAWYLWHWPVFLLGAAVLGAAPPEARAGLALLSLALAGASHALVEAPLRDAARFPLPARGVLAATVLMMAATGALVLRWHDRAQQQYLDAQQQPYVQARLDAPVIYGMGCDGWFHGDELKVCEFGSGQTGKTVVAIGDSIGMQWFPALEAAFVPRGWRLLAMTKSSCPLVDEPQFLARIGRRFEECERWRAQALEQIVRIRPDLVIMGSTHTYDFSEAQWRDGTARVLNAIAGSVGRVYILQSTPALPFDAPACLAPRGWLYRQLASADRCSEAIGRDRRDDVKRWLAAGAAAFGNVRMLDLTDAVCPGGVCSAQRQGRIVFRDHQHLSAAFSRTMGDALAQRLELDGGAGP